MAADDRMMIERLLDCARAGDQEGVLASLDAGAAVDARDAETDRTALMEAAGSAAADVGLVKLLIERGADVNAVAYDRPLFETQAQADALKEIVGEHSGVKDGVLAAMKPELRGMMESVFAEMWTAKQHAVRENVLRIAVRAGNLKKVEAVLKAGADIGYRLPSGYEVLVDAAFGDGRELVPIMSLLIQRGTRLDATSDYGESALSVNSRRGRFDAVRVLLEAGAQGEILQWTPLMRAAALGTVADVRVELDKGGDLAAVDRWSRTAWLVAVQSGDVAKAKMLLEAGASRGDRGCGGTTALMMALESRRWEMMRWLLEDGFDVDEVGSRGQTALMAAAEEGDDEGMKILLDAGADIGRRDESDRPVMKMASTVEGARMLAEHGADLNDMDGELRAKFTGLRGDGRIRCTAEEYQTAKHQRFGRANPELMNEPFWLAMIRSRANAHAARTRFSTGADNVSRPAVWSFQRFGCSINVLPNGRIIEIAGEHEDYYDPDFCIYNDVVVHQPNGKIEIWGYPEEVFPPTDFHTATQVGKYLYLVGNLGYVEQRRCGETQVYRLNTETMVMERVETKGDGPGWISEHKARYDGVGNLEVWNGKVYAMRDGAARLVKNEERFVLDIESGEWQRGG